MSDGYARIRKCGQGDTEGYACCGSEKDVKTVQMRIPGTATAYRFRWAVLCHACRKRFHGSWMHAR